MAGGTRLGTHRGRTGRRRYTPMSEINVTPFVDVMLVLLIVFMISAPLLTAGVPVDLPRADAKPLLGDDEPITVTVDPSGKLYLQETEITLDEIVPKLIAIARAGYDERIYVQGRSDCGIRECHESDGGAVERRLPACRSVDTAGAQVLIASHARCDHPLGDCPLRRAAVGSSHAAFGDPG